MSAPLPRHRTSAGAPRVVVVAVSPPLLQSVLERALRNGGWDVAVAATAEEARGADAAVVSPEGPIAADQLDCDLLVVLPGRSGADGFFCYRADPGRIPLPARHNVFEVLFEVLSRDLPPTPS